MTISDFAIKRPIITIVVMVAISVFGIFALLRLNTDEFPEVSPPIVSVAIPYPGAAPETVEREVVTPIEEQIAAISGVKEVKSNSLDSYGVIVVEFYFSKNLQEATQDIRDGISQIRNDLPQEMEEPILTRFDPNDFPIVQLALTSQTLTGPELTRIVDPGVKRQLRGLRGVAEVRVVGGIERELTVDIALRWGTGWETEQRAFVNIIATPKGGTHVSGFERGLVKAFRDVLPGTRLQKSGDPDVIKDDVLEGLTAVVTVRLAIGGRTATRGSKGER